jgi:NADPH:quinone reductase-like Zn-dependent oxidoreductase
MKNQTMKALTFKRYGKSPGIGFADRSRPTLKADELLVQVHAASVNPIDNMILTGIFKPVLHFQLPATLGSDLAGVVTEVGSGVTRFKPGDAVFANIFDLGTGAIAEFAVVPERLAALKPANLDFVQAASIPMVGLTSWQALKERANLRAGQKVFIPAGSGGIGTFAIQLAKHLGAKVGTTTSTGNVELVRSLGADEVVDYKKQEFEKVLRGYDAVLGTVRGDAIEKSIGILKPGARSSLCRAAGRRIRSRSTAQLRPDLRVRVDEPQDHAPCEKAGRHLLLSLCAPRWRSTRRNRRTPQGGAHPARDRQGVSVRAGKGRT